MHTLNEFPIHYEINTRWKDMDSFGHINNAIYLTYIENARVDLFNRWNIVHPEKSIILASIKIDFIKEIKHPTTLIVGSKVKRTGNSSFDIQSNIYNKKENFLLSTSLATCVCYNYLKMKSIFVYPEIKKDYLEE